MRSWRPVRLANPPLGDLGGTTAITAAGLPTNTGVTFYLGATTSYPIGGGTTNGQGTITNLQLTVPMTAQLGALNITARDSVKRTLYPAAAPYRTLAPNEPGIEVAPWGGNPGITFTVSGIGYAPGETVELDWTPPATKTVLGTVTANGNGSFFWQPFAPGSVHAGTYSIAGVGRTSGKKAAATYAVSYKTSIQLGTATTLYANDEMDPLVGGGDFAPGETISMTADGIYLGSTTADKFGTIDQNPFAVWVSCGLTCAWPVVATGMSSGAVGRTTYTQKPYTPTLTITAPSPRAGAVISMTRAGSDSASS